MSNCDSVCALFWICSFAQRSTLGKQYAKLFLHGFHRMVIYSYTYFGNETFAFNFGSTSGSKPMLVKNIPYNVASSQYIVHW